MLVYIIVMLSADLLSIQAHTPSPEPKQYEKKQWDWYNQDDMVIRDGPQGKVWFRFLKESIYSMLLTQRIWCIPHRILLSP